MLISPKQALALELKLNKSQYKKEWIKLGDCLYNWRLNPKYNKIQGELSYKVTTQQMEWIKENIISGVLSDKCYTLIENKLNNNKEFRELDIEKKRCLKTEI